MGKVLLGLGRLNQDVTLGGFTLWGSTPGTAGSTEANTQRALRVAGTFSRLSGRVNASGTSRSLQFRLNTANGNEVISFTDSTAETVTDTTHTDSVGATDLVCLQVNGTAPAYQIPWSTIIFEGTSQHATQYLTASASIGAFQALAAGVGNATEANVQNKMRCAGTVVAASIFITTASVGASTYTLRKNGADTSIVITQPASTTGTFEDTSHSVSFAAGDLLNWATTAAGTGAVGRCGVTATFDALISDLWMYGNGVTFNASTQYGAPVGIFVSPTTTETDVRVPHGFDVVTTNFRANVVSNTLASTMTVRVRKNGADGNQSLSITSGTTGYFEDTTNFDIFNPTDELCYSFSGGTSGSLGNTLIGITEHLPINAAATLPGSSSLRVDTAKSKTAAVTLPGIGSLSASIRSQETTAATLNGNSTLSANTLKYKTVAATLNGLSNLSVDTTKSKTAVAVLAGIGALSADITQQMIASAILNGQGFLSVDTVKSKSVAALLNGIGTLSVDVSQIKVATAVLMGQSDLSSSAIQNMMVDSLLIGQGNLSAATTQIMTASALLLGEGNLSSLVTLNQNIAANLDGVGLLSADASHSTISQASAELNGTSDLSVDALLTAVAFLQLDGAGTLSVSTVKSPLEAVLTGTSDLSATVFDIHPGEATLGGRGNLIVFTTAGLSAAAILRGMGTMSVEASGGVTGGTISSNLPIFVTMGKLKSF